MRLEYRERGEMDMADWIVGGILLFVIGAAGRYIY